MTKTITELIQVDTSLVTPVYKQIVQSICRTIENGALNKGDVLPSVNKISEVFQLARGSVFTAYNELRASGIIDSIPGKGYFVSSTETRQQKRVFLLFSSFTSYKESLFNSLLESLPKNYVLDIYFHHHDIKTFENLVRDRASYYHVFVIVPEVNVNTVSILSLLDQKKLFLLDAGFKEYKNEYRGVFQNEEKDIYTILLTNQDKIDRYKRLYLVVPGGNDTKNIVNGFNKFSRKISTTTGIKNNVDLPAMKKGDGYIVTDDSDLVEIVQHAKKNQWILGKDIGVISYNESILKSMIGNGISTITTDFKTMGNSMADLIVTGKRAVIENPFIMIDRKSF